MNNLREIWGQRFVHYITELQKYLKYVFTGHLAIVLVFTLGAGGYAYSEWLKEVPANFPAILLTALVIGASLTFATPITLLKPADSVYFLPLEKKLSSYLERALNWTTVSQLLLPLALYIVSLPLLVAVGNGANSGFVWMALMIIVLKWLFVRTEYFFRHARNGKYIWGDRLIRFLMAASLVYFWLSHSLLFALIIFIALFSYNLYWQKKKDKKPFPYDHFIELEQNRMMRFYRFANYFTDVPHLKGSVSRRGWLTFVLGSATLGKSEAQAYLVKRTFLRTDDIFWLWVRLTIISLVGAIFIPFPIVVFIFSGALAFASSIQLIYALQSGDEFRMDLLFPEPKNTRPAAIRKIVRTVQWIQAGIVVIAAFVSFKVLLTPLLVGCVILIVSEATIRLTAEKAEDY
ncbi:ABC transporter permease [Sporosarcina sp. CAU 1771]